MKKMSTGEAEKSFFQSLKSVVLHLIKNAEPRLYRDLVPLIQTYDEKACNKLAPDQQQAHLETAIKHLEEDGEIAHHFQDYPHEWSREKYGQAKQSLSNYLDVLN